jgi:hypothetical protein
MVSVQRLLPQSTMMSSFSRPASSAAVDDGVGGLAGLHEDDDLARLLERRRRSSSSVSQGVQPAGGSGVILDELLGLGVVRL